MYLVCKTTISLVSISTTLTLFINSSTDFPISFLPWPITSTNRMGILDEKKGICNTSLGNCGSLVTLSTTTMSNRWIYKKPYQYVISNINKHIKQVKKWDETHSLVWIQAVWLHAPLLAIYMRNITYLCIMVWIHMDSHKYIFGSHNRKYINYGSSHRFSLPFWSMCPWTRMLIDWESYSPPISDTLVLPSLPTLKFEMK